MFFSLFHYFARMALKTRNKTTLYNYVCIISTATLETKLFSPETTCYWGRGVANGDLLLLVTTHSLIDNGETFSFLRLKMCCL